MIDQQLSLNFWLSESVKTGRRGLLRVNQEMGVRRLPKLVLMAVTQLQPLRDDLEVAVDPTSWYRCPELNKAVKSLPISQHIRGEATDYNKRGAKWNRNESRMVFQRQLELFKLNGTMFGQLVFEEIKTRFGSVFWIHSSLGYPFRPLARCGEVKLRIDHKGILLEKVDFRGWRG